jgi:uncharacterized damage-inducible protein DinB/GNAT superfamily N-acetyltransferase
MDKPVEIRPLAARDSIDALTALLHRAYAPLAAEGMNFTAAAQDVEITARRAAEGQCFVATWGHRIVGTVTVCGPYEAAAAPWALSVPWFCDRDTAHFHQFAVAPELQGQGLGRRLVSRCEQWAREHGFRRMALDTAEHASALRSLYQRLGYGDVGHAQWEGRNFRSVIMQKSLDRSPLREHLQTLARYHVWATKRLLAHVEELPEADYRRDAGLFFRSVHGTLNHLLVAESTLWQPRFAEGLSPQVDLAAEAEPDRVALAERLAKAALAWLPMIEAWTEARLQGALAYRRLGGEALSLPFAATLAHVFNHGTHHRGQISAALTAMGRAGPELDMVVMLQEESRA